VHLKTKREFGVEICCFSLKYAIFLWGNLQVSMEILVNLAHAQTNFPAAEAINIPLPFILQFLQQNIHFYFLMHLIC
jgi:hypothetical protein